MGATTNPTIVGTVMKQEYDIWAPRVREIIAAEPDLDRPAGDLAGHRGDGHPGLEDAGADLPGRTTARRAGSPSRSTRPSTARSRRWSSRLATSTRSPPTSRSSSPPRRPASRPWSRSPSEGISINATVSFTVPQALAVGEAMERALAKREAAGHDTSWMAPDLHHHDRPHRRLGEDGQRARRHHRRPRRARLGRHRRLQARRRDLRGARLSHAPAGGRVPAPPALVRAHRRRRLHDHPLRLAAALQRLGGRGQGPLGRPGAAGLRGRAAGALPRVRARPTSPTACSIDEFADLRRHRCGRCAPSWPRTGSWSAPSTT